MTAICLVRHGETDWNVSEKLQGQTDIPLNGTGIRQAEECSAYFRPEDWDVLVTSPLKRARQTADIINRKLALPVVEMECFMERYFGKAEGMDVTQRTAIYPDKDYPGQEDPVTFRERILDGLEKVQQAYADGRVLLIAHGAVISELLLVLSEGEISSKKAPLVNACVSNIQYQQKTWKIVNYNQVSHLSYYQGFTTE
ncbi:histidine phosphatase family protein [Planococcus salinus]|uniref:Histidine phosphatase family protein n=1 Tax=Planococcus salinus TaxID=1848460 RepID=A0A3M8PBR3_9BACL|nr:histidine phosphatase family protein [Planococcus salinus]RNF41149.1 histidine phosphatase family protein [Planococcus salinus]